MSEIKNSTTDIDNNVQEEDPKPTPKKQRLSRAEKARLESEELLKSLGVTMEAGRQTRSSRRGPATTTTFESPKPETPKRKAPSTPRVPKKGKIVTADQTDGTNHVEENNENNAQIVDAPTANSVEPVKDVQNTVAETPAETKSTIEQMDVDTPIENTPPKVSPKPEETTPQEQNTQEDAVPQSEAVQTIEDSPPASQAEIESPIGIEEPEIVESQGVSAAADTTTASAIESETVVIEPDESNKDDSEPIDLQSSPSDIDSKEEIADNSQAIKEPTTIVELESSSNEGDTKPNSVQGLDSLDLEVINSDSSLDESDVQVKQPAQEQPVSTSTADVIITEIIDDAPINKTNNNADNSVHSSETAQNSVESTNNAKPIDIPENYRTTITVENPIEEIITTTSTSTLEPNATTA